MQEEVVAAAAEALRNHGQTWTRDIKGKTLADANSYHGVFFVADATPPPCDTCERRDECAANELACAQFLRYTQCADGWEEFPKEPTAEIFDIIFEDDDSNGGSTARADVVKGNTAKLHEIAAELVIRDRMALLAYEHRSNTEVGRQARAEIDDNYTDEAIAARVGSTAQFVSRVRREHALFSAKRSRVSERSKGSVNMVGRWLRDASLDANKYRSKEQA